MKKLLVANRGEIARRVIRTARRMDIATVALFSDADHDAAHVREADEAVRLPGLTALDTYLDIGKVLSAARVTGADAVHPGYGFLSENAAFARACAATGVVFVGPSPEAIGAMGSKIEAKDMMAAAGVPVLPGGVVQAGYVVPASDYPVLVKAAFGGGGRGMRIARNSDELADALAGAAREAEAAFGDGTVFVERYLESPRHIEVQIFGDTHGNVIHLFERECSIQRRYQKIIEEAPSPAVTGDLRQALCDAAIAAGKALDYVGAGTVEFVLDASGAFYFLEVNTRLQVEHPITEMITGLDLVELQLRVARGERLDVDPVLDGHAIEARLYAEDVPTGFVPASGRIERFTIPERDGVRVDGGYEVGSFVSTFYDAMLAKVIAKGDDRAQAINLLADTLAVAQVHGVPTNRELLVRILRDAEFHAAHIDTGFIDRLPPAFPVTGSSLEPRAVAAALCAQAERRASTPVQRALPSGWRNVPSQAQHTTYRDNDRNIDVGYRFTPDRLEVSVDGRPLTDVTLWQADADGVDITIGGIRRQFAVHQIGQTVYVDGLGATVVLIEVDRFPVPERAAAPGSMVAPLPGTVVRVLVQPGDAVPRDQLLVVIEAMKMEHAIRSSHAGTVREVTVAAGDQVDSGHVLVVIEETDE